MHDDAIEAGYLAENGEFVNLVESQMKQSAMMLPLQEGSRSVDRREAWRAIRSAVSDNREELGAALGRRW